MRKLVFAIALLFAGSTFGASANVHPSDVAIFQDNREEIEKEDLPEAVMDAWENSQYSDYEIVAVYKVSSTNATDTEEITGAETTGGEATGAESGTGTTYEIEYTNDEGTRGSVTFNENGEMVQ